MFGATKMVLGVTPIKTTTTRKARRYLFTPTASTAAPATPAVPAPSTPVNVTVDTDAGTFVQLKVPGDDPHVNAVAILLQRTNPSSTTVDIVWVSDGAKVTMEAQDLKEAPKKQPAATVAAVTAPDDSVFGSDRSILTRTTRSHRDLISEKFPADP